MSYNYNYPRPMVTVDAVVFGLDKDKLQVLLVKRGKDPYRDRWALPGGFVDIDETLERAVERELEEETGLANLKLFHHKPYSIPDRDPRGRNISFAFTGFTLRSEKDVVAGDDAVEVRWFDALEPPLLAFDHSEILSDAILKLRELAFTSDIVASALPSPFEKEMLIKALEIVMDGELDSTRTLAHFIETGLALPDSKEPGKLLAQPSLLQGNDG